MNENHADRIATFFEHFSRADLQRLGDVYTAGASFKDPFNEVQGLPAIRRVYEHMFETLDEPRFVITHRMLQGEECWLAWEFRFRIKSYRPHQGQVVRGASHLLLDEGGRIRSHRDYWDAAEELYEKLPMLGTLLRWVRKRMQAR